MTVPVRSRVRVEGIVQGVGYRPFVHGLATRLGLAGFVGNDVHGVFAEVEGTRGAVDAFVAALSAEAPPLALVERVSAEAIQAHGETVFRIVESAGGGERRTLISPDSATCDDCLRELFDPADRRFRYPFLNCTNCGPRFTIVRDVPYDRPFTTMAGFDMCGACAREYADPGDRRFHAQPTCCPACGPSLRLTNDGSGGPDACGGGEALIGAVGLLRAGRVVAIKGLGGYHLAADAASEPAVAELRGRKHREDKAFALLVPDVGAARALCEVDADEERTLTSVRRPIVLLARRSPRDAEVARSVAPGNRFLGVMLPYTPLHHLLARDVGRALVLTSGNVSDEPIVYRDEEAFDRLEGIADAFLSHDRPIHIRTDDSVVRVIRSRERPIRRSRGYVPSPVPLPWELRRPILACGAELKNTFAVAKGRRVFVSHHIGDLDDIGTLRAFSDGIAHFERIFDVVPQIVAHDLHPEYLSTAYALGLESGVPRVGVQHHHAHVASCLVDNGECDPVIGVAFDGTGFGTDGTIWGGEFLVADLLGFERAGHLETVPMPGGEAAIREPWRMAAAYLDAAFGDDAPRDLGVIGRNRERWDGILAVARGGLNAPRTSSAGRLFDAVAALLGVRDAINYEGQAAVELEQLAEPAEPGAYAARVDDGPGGTLVVRGTDLVRAVVEDVRSGVPAPVIAARFHGGLCDAIVAVVMALRERSGLDTVALSGGVFQNVLLESRTVAALAAGGFRVLTHERVPPNDGGISLGQVAVAGARDRAGRLDGAS